MKIARHFLPSARSLLSCDSVASAAKKETPPMLNECVTELQIAKPVRQTLNPEDRLVDRAMSSLKASGLFHNADLRLEIRAGAVILRGVVASWHEKQLAQEALRAVSDLVFIRNLLEVRRIAMQ